MAGGIVWPLILKNNHEVRMRVILFGGTGMMGQGVLRECLLDERVEAVLSIVRSPSTRTHPKLRELVHRDFTDFSKLCGEWAGYDACFFCLGVSSAGMNEATYRHLTCDITLAAANALVAANPSMTFVYVSGTGTDTSERGRSMWARVKGKTENALLAMPFKAVMFRPGFIQPMHGIRSKTRLYRWLYNVVGPLYPLWKALFPKYITTTEQVGRAMIAIAVNGSPKRWLENRDINELANS